MSAEKRPRGRPPLPSDRRRRHNLTLRIRSDLKARLGDHASDAGRSLSEEAERRLEQSFDQRQFVRELAEQLWRDMAAVIQERGEVSARAFAIETWGEAWTANEWDALLQFAAIAGPPRSHEHGAEP